MADTNEKLAEQLTSCDLVKVKADLETQGHFRGIVLEEFRRGMHVLVILIVFLCNEVITVYQIIVICMVMEDATTITNTTTTTVTMFTLSPGCTPALVAGGVYTLVSLWCLHHDHHHHHHYSVSRYYTNSACRQGSKPVMPLVSKLLLLLLLRRRRRR